MKYIDAHVHVWTDDTGHYPLGEGWKKEDMKPARFTPEDLFKHMKATGVNRVNLIQMSYYCPKDMSSKKGNGFDNSYMTDMIDLHKEVFVGTAVIDPQADGVEKTMTALGKKGVKAFRIHPRLTTAKIEKWLEPAGYSKMFVQAARNGQALSCLIDPDALPEVDRLCKKHPGTTVIIDHLCRIGAAGTIDDKSVKALCDLAKHKKVMVKVGAFYALGKKKAPYTDLSDLIETVVKAYGVERCMWESDCPFQVVGGHTYKDSIELVKSGLKFLSAGDRDWLLRKTAEKVFFGG
jgi:predicted TIM-barrel fold metal-dependent hydrolase